MTFYVTSSASTSYSTTSGTKPAGLTSITLADAPAGPHLERHCCGGAASRITAPFVSLSTSTENFWIACRSGVFTEA